MQKIYFTEDKVSLCHKNNCIDVKGDVAKIIAFGLALMVVVSGISTLLESSK